MNTATLKGEDVSSVATLQPSIITYYYRHTVDAGIVFKTSVRSNSVSVIIRAVEKERTQ